MASDLKPAKTETVKSPGSPQRVAPTATTTAASNATANTVNDKEDELERKRRERAERFGIPVSTTPKPQATSTQGQKQEKQGQPASSAKPTPAKLAIDPEILKRRAERFGLPVPGESGSPSAIGKRPVSAIASPKVASDKKPKLVLTEEEQEKLRKRAERFGLPVKE
jgi:SAP domain-containing ribonucleoprotein